MNVLKIASVLVAISLALPLSGRAQTTLTEAANNLYDTAIDTTNPTVTLGGGSNDINYIVTSAPVGSGITTPSDALVVHQANLPAGWVANDTGATPPSRWDSVSATAANEIAGTYAYVLTLTNIPTDASVSISGNVAADNQLNILANGTQKFALTTNPTYAASFNPFSFTFTASGSSTSDTLTFDVINTGTTATGLQVQGLAGTYTPVPEPRDWAVMLLLGVGGLVAVRKLRAGFTLA